MTNPKNIMKKVETTKVLAGHMFVETGNVTLNGKSQSSLKTNPQAAKVGLGKGGKGCEAIKRGSSRRG